MKLIISLILSLLLISVSFAQTDSDDDSKKVKREQKKIVRKLLKSAVNSWDTGELEIVLQSVDSILIIDSKNPDAYYYKARYLARTGDTVMAHTTLETGILAAPKSSRLRLYLAYLDILQGDYLSAAQLADEILAVKPNHAKAHFLKGWSLLHQADTLASLEYLEKATELSLFKKEL